MMRAFVAVVQHMSFGAAAERLSVSPSFVSKGVSQLEQSLGVRLLIRTTRHLEITGIGQHYYESCVSILSAVEAADDRARDMQRNPRGTVTLRAPHSFAIFYLAPAVARFNEQYPDIEITLMIDENPAQSLTAMKRGLDLALHLGPMPIPGLIAKELGEAGWSVYASEGYLAKKAAPLLPEELALHNCLVHVGMWPDHKWHLSSPLGAKTVSVSGSLSSNSILVLRDAVMSGVGISILPDYFTADGRGQSLVRVLPAYTGPRRKFSLAYARDRTVPRRVKSFMDFLVAWFRASPWNS